MAGKRASEELRGVMREHVRAKGAMKEGGGISDSDTDSDETIIEGSVAESDLEEDEPQGKRLSLIGKDMASKTENNHAEGIKIINGETLSPEIHRIHSLRRMENINLLYQETNEKEKESQSLLYTVIPSLDSEVTGLQGSSEKNELNDECSPEVSLLSGIQTIVELSKDSVTKCTKISEDLQKDKMTSNKEDATEISLSETAASDIIKSRIMAEEFEIQTLLEPLCDSENSQMSPFHFMLEYQNNPLYETESLDDSNALPEELLAAINSFSESVVSPLCQPVGKEDGQSMAEKQPVPELIDDCTQIANENFESQFHVQHLKETESLRLTQSPFLPEEQLDCNQHLQKLVILDHQTLPSYNRPPGKENSSSDETSSCKQTIQATSDVLQKSTQHKGELPCSDVDAASERFLKQEIQNDQAQTGSSETQQSNMTTKGEQMKKIQRIVRISRKKNTSKTYFSDSSCSHISLSRINKRDIFGQTLLHKAAVENDLNRVCAMIKAGANVNAQDNAGWTPLHEASLAGFFEITQELLKAGANVNCKGSEQITPLHEAARQGHYKVAAVLLWYGANPLLKERKGKSAIEEATDNRIRKLLESYIDNTNRRTRSAKRLVEDPVIDQSKIDKSQSPTKVKTNLSDRVQLSFNDNTKELKQQRVKRKPKKGKWNPQHNSVTKIQGKYRLLKGTTSKSPSQVSKAKQLVTVTSPSSLGLAESKMRKSYQREVTQNDSVHKTRLHISKRILQPSVCHEPDRICEAGEQLRVLTETQQKCDSDNSNNYCSSEREKAHQSTQLPVTTKDKLIHSNIVTTLIPIQEESSLPSVTHQINESSVNSTWFLDKDIGLSFLKEGQCIMKQDSNVPSYLQVDSLGDNPQTTEKMALVCTNRKEGINPVNEQNREQYKHSENSVYHDNLDSHTEEILAHELSLKDSLSMTESISLKENSLESKNVTTQMLQETSHFSDSVFSVLSEVFHFIADQIPLPSNTTADKNTSEAAGICNEQTVQDSMEMSSTCAFSQDTHQTKKRQIPGALDSSHFSKKMKTTSCQPLPSVAARIYKRNAKGESSLHMAAKKGDLSLVKSLIASGACVNQKDNAGWTPIHEASNGGYTEIIAELLKAGADVNCKGLGGVLPIHDAVSGNYFEAVQFLLQHGAKINETDDYGNNALDEATCDKMIELLKSYGATEIKKTCSMSDVAGRELRHSKPRRICICYDCNEKNNLISHSSAAKQKCDTHESLSKILQDIEKKQVKLLLLELKSQKDADLYIHDLPQIQNLLNQVFAKQKSERDDLAKKYRASMESFKQGALREQLVKLVSRQKSLLLMAQRQKELGQKIQKYNNAKKDSSHSAKKKFNSCARNNTKNSTSSKTAACPDEVKDLETSLVVTNSSLDQEMSQFPNRSPNVSGGNGIAIRHEKVGLHNLVPENRFVADIVAEELNSKTLDSIDQTILPSEPIVRFIQTAQPEKIDYVSVASQGNKLPSTPTTPIVNISASGNVGVAVNQLTTEDQHVCIKEPLQQHSNMKPTLELESTRSYLVTHQKNIFLNNRVAIDGNSEPTETFSYSLSPCRFSQNPSQSSDNQDSERKLKFQTKKRRNPELLDLLKLGKIKPGDDVLEFTLQDSKYKASLLGNGKVKTPNSVYQSPVHWIKALLGTSVRWKYVWNKVTYCGILLSTITAEVEESFKKPELPQQQKSVSGWNSVEQDHSYVPKSFHSIQKPTSLHDVCNIQQEDIPSCQEEVEFLPSPEIEAEEPSSVVRETTKYSTFQGSVISGRTKSSYQSDLSNTLKRFLQFNEIVLIKEEELMPSNIMDQYWNFYVHCENFGF